MGDVKFGMKKVTKDLVYRVLTQEQFIIIPENYVNMQGNKPNITYYVQLRNDYVNNADKVPWLVGKNSYIDSWNQPREDGRQRVYTYDKKGNCTGGILLRDKDTEWFEVTWKDNKYEKENGYPILIQHHKIYNWYKIFIYAHKM